MPNPANPQSLNRYSYVVNNPLRYIDPTGHMFTDDQCGYQGQDCGGYLGGTGGGVGNVDNGGDDGDKEDESPTPLSTNGGGSQPLLSLESGASNPNYWPDYYIGSIFIPVYPPFPIFGIDITVIMDAYENWYVVPGGGLSWGPSASIGAGWLLGPDNDHEDVVEKFLQEHSFNISGGGGLGIGVNNVHPSYIQLHNEGSNIEDISVEGLITSPGVTAVFGYGFLFYDNGDETPWIWQGD